MDASTANETMSKVTSERDLYWQLLKLVDCDDLESLLRQALALLMKVTGAHHGYLELYDDATDEARWSAAHDLSSDEMADVRRVISRGIVAETLSRGKMVVTAAALLDPRFHERASVQSGNLGAVMCAPIGDDGACGVVYLEGRSSPGMFSEDDQERVALAARHIAAPARRLLAEQQRQRRNDPTREFRESLRLNGIVGRSPALAAVLRQVALVAPLNITVLLTGESGTGKSLLARVIHDNGPRVTRPFIEVNCGALPETLIESELFGAMPGAHSTASRRVDGKVTAAAGGTLFLDEIALLSPAAQAKLLQLLQSKQYYPLGSSTPIDADIRVIAATNIDLKQAVAERQFREDLYYRLHVLPLRVPSLAERHDDLVEIAAHLCATVCARNGFPVVSLSRNATREILLAPWPGNIRQLANAIEAAAIRATAEGAAQIEVAHLFPEARDALAREAQKAPTFQEATRRFQRDLLAQSLEECGWNVVDTARRLDMARSHLYTLIRAFDLVRQR